MVEPNAYGHETLFSQGRKHALEKRSLAQSGDTEEHGEHASCDPALQVLILGVRPLKKRAAFSVNESRLGQGFSSSTVDDRRSAETGVAASAGV